MESIVGLAATFGVAFLITFAIYQFKKYYLQKRS
jgi:hypothetical protein